MKDGRPYQGMGINYFDVFTRMIGGPETQPAEPPETMAHHLAFIRNHDVAFIRFNAGGFYPVNWQLYLTDKEQYFSRLDALVHEAERQGLGLIPSLFWTFSTLPDLVHEPLNQWGNPQSKTIAFMRQYTREVVGRYVNSPAIWGWEFGNEYMLEADLPGVSAKGGQGWTYPNLGQPAQRGPNDQMTGPAIRAAYVEFARTVREIDPHRAIFTGDAEPRCAAYHNRHEQSWTLDSPAQWVEAFLGDNPDPIDTLTIHHYPFDPSGKQHNGVHGYSSRERLAFCAEAARLARKPLFVGEFGPSNDGKDPALRRKEFFEIYQALLDTHVPLAAFWNYNLASQPENSVTETKDVYILDAIGQANRAWARRDDLAIKKAPQPR